MSRRKLVELDDGMSIHFDRGEFDYYCINVMEPGDNQPWLPLDEEYFTMMQEWAEVHGADKLYEDFVKLYEAVSTAVRAQDETPNQDDLEALALVQKLSEGYGEDAVGIRLIFMVLYAGMVAEVNKEATKLGKRVKRLGIYQVLMDGLTPVYAANYSKGKPWRDLSIQCRKRGF